MKVCFVTANYPPEAVGGTEQVVSALARELRAAGVQVAVISGSDRHHDGKVDVYEETFEDVPVSRLRRRHDEVDHRGVQRSRMLDLIEQRLSLLRPDVVHVHSFAHLGVGAGAVCKAMRIPMVLSFHDLWVTCPRYFRVPVDGLTCPTGAGRDPCAACVGEAFGGDLTAAARAIDWRDTAIRDELKRGRAWIAPSATTARLVKAHVPFRKPIEVIPHGLLRPVAAADLAPRPRDGEVLRVGTFGGLVRVKGVRELVAATAGLPCEVHLSGPFHEPDLERELRALAAANGTRLVLRGRYTAADRHPVRDLHLAVFPSKCQETYGLVVDEALAHGVPAVVSDQGALAERRGQGGVVVTPIADLANVLRELVTSRDRLAALRRAIPAELPTIATSAQRHLELYRRLVSV